MLKNLLLVFLSGGAGSVLRYLTSLLAVRWVQPAAVFPVATFTANIIGCFLVGLFLGLIDKGTLLHPTWRLLLIVGFCGGYTTFSAFSAENFLLLQHGEYLRTAFYVAASIVLGLAAVYLGFSLIK